MIYIIGIGAGALEEMTLRAVKTIEKCDVIVGYNTYIDLIGPLCNGKKIIRSGMKQEVERCNVAVDFALNDEDVAVISSGDAGVYGMAGLIYEVLEKRGLAGLVPVEVVSGVTSSVAVASILGAPLMHDFCHISLSDLLTPLDLIYKRVMAALETDMVIAIYNPRSKGRQDYLQKVLYMALEQKGDLVCGYVRNAYREGQKSSVLRVSELLSKIDEIDMFTTVIIGNSETKIIESANNVKQGLEKINKTIKKMVTPRGYTLITCNYEYLINK